MDHETLHLGHASSVAEAERWMAEHRVDWGPAALSDPLTRFGIFATDGNIAESPPFPQSGKLRYLASQPLFVAEIGDTLCWDGTRVQLHVSHRQGVETCSTKEADMIKKHGTGTILTETDDDRIVRTAVLTEDQLSDILDEGEEADTEGE